VREPLNGVRAVCPVAAETTGWLLSARKVVEAFVHAAELPSEAWGARRAVNLPGKAVSVKEILAALREVAGAEVAERVDFVPDARIEAIVRTWAPRYDAVRGLAMGFKADEEMASVIRDYMDSVQGAPRAELQSGFQRALRSAHRLRFSESADIMVTKPPTRACSARCAQAAAIVHHATPRRTQP
jgi:hypothetical protein